MALFRFKLRRLKKTVSIKDSKELLEYLASWWQKQATLGAATKESMLRWQIYINEEKDLDDQVGWYSVFFQVKNSNFFHVGYVSEPLEARNTKSC